jgi:hypothetical protein
MCVDSYVFDCRYTPYYPFRAVEFACLCVSTLLVLRRLLKHALEPKTGSSKRLNPENHVEPDFSESRSSESAGRAERNHPAIRPASSRIQLLFNVFAGTVLLLCAVGLCCGLADAVFYNSQKEFAERAYQAVNATTQKDTSQSLKFKTYVEVAGLYQAEARSAQHFCEVIPLHLLIAVFMVVGYRRCYSACPLFPPILRIVFLIFCVVSFLMIVSSRAKLELASERMTEADLTHGTKLVSSAKVPTLQ